MLAEILAALREIFPRATAPPLPPPAAVNQVAKNRKAFLDMLAWSEGTSTIPNSDNGYRAQCGGGTFSSYSSHPNQKVWVKRIGAFSDAAGRYQLMARYYAPYCKQLGLKDFSPASQDAICLQQLREVHALDDIDAGRFSAAVAKAGARWASLPGSKLGQTIRTFAQVKDAYSEAGGQFAMAA